MDRTTRAWLLWIVATSFALNLWAIDFGLPDGWHPDEVVGRAATMARNFSLNPHDFRYGSLHLYQVLAVIVPTYLLTDLLSLPEATQKTAVYLAARALTAAFGAGCVALTFLLAQHLFSRVAAVLSALFLALTVGFVNIAHFATTDIPMLFWMLAALLMSAYVLTSGERKWYVLAGVFAGFAAGAKYPGGIVLLNLIAAHLLSKRGDRDHVALLLGILASAISFVAVNPSLLFASCEFIEGFIRDAAFHGSFGKEGGSVLSELPANLSDLMGPALALVVCVAPLYAVGLLIGGRQKSEILFVFSALVSFIFILSSVHFTHARYVVPLLPPLLVLVGKMLADSINATSIFVRYVGRVTAFTVLVFSALYTVAGNLQFTFDSRKLAAAWIERNAPAGSKIEVTSYGPTLPDGRFTIVERPKLRDLSDALATLEEAPIYQLLQPIYLDYRLFAEDVGLCEYRRPHYRGWYDARMDRNDEIARTFDLSIHGLEKRAPDFVIASSFYYDRYKDDNNSVEGEMFDRLFAGDSVYRQVAEIHYQFLPWRDPPLEFINPTVRIFQRADTLAQPSRSPDLAPPKE